MFVSTIAISGTPLLLEVAEAAKLGSVYSLLSFYFWEFISFHTPRAETDGYLIPLQVEEAKPPIRVILTSVLDTQNYNLNFQVSTSDATAYRAETSPDVILPKPPVAFVNVSPSQIPNESPLPWSPELGLFYLQFYRYRGWVEEGSDRMRNLSLLTNSLKGWERLAEDMFIDPWNLAESLRYYDEGWVLPFFLSRLTPLLTAYYLGNSPSPSDTMPDIAVVKLVPVSFTVNIVFMLLSRGGKDYMSSHTLISRVLNVFALPVTVSQSRFPLASFEDTSTVPPSWNTIWFELSLPTMFTLERVEDISGYVRDASTIPPAYSLISVNLRGDMLVPIFDRTVRDNEGVLLGGMGEFMFSLTRPRPKPFPSGGLLESIDMNISIVRGSGHGS